MQNIITAAEICEFHQKGIRQIPVSRMPLLTDLAREELERLGMEFVVESISASSPSVPVTDETKKPNGYGGGITYSRSGIKLSFKEYINGNRKIVGTFIATPHPVMTEFVGHLGFDFVAIDSEHSAMHLETVQKMLQGLSGTPTYGMVRVPGITYEAISGTLDIGADAVLVPQVRTVGDILKIRDFSQYPPVGRRGVGPGRFTVYGNEIGKLAENTDLGTGIVVQIETVQAVESIDEILKVSDFIDMFFIGPGDLSMDMGIFAQFSDPRLIDTIMMLREKTRRAGKKLGIFAGNFDAACNWSEKGFDMVIINSELGLLGTAISSEIFKIKSLIGG